MADALDSGSSGRKVVEVQLLSSALTRSMKTPAEKTAAFFIALFLCVALSRWALAPVARIARRQAHVVQTLLGHVCIGQ